MPTIKYDAKNGDLKMKKLIVINGTMGVGKTTICSLLNKKLEPSVWLDADWCWKMNPWKGDEKNKRMVEDNITHLLNNFLLNDNFQYVIFNWVLHKESIWQTLSSKLVDTDYELHRITLLCDKEKLRERAIKDNRSPDAIIKNSKNNQLSQTQNGFKIDTTNLTIEQVVEKIMGLL